ncbi:MAG: hypothetical protein JSW58_05080 [Candidatus Latescibacterota bacterium]|nr:MAG: hypothetical protein JSW58_05080 [Candidatus Latescibacterota bacterium]
MARMISVLLVVFCASSVFAQTAPSEAPDSLWVIGDQVMAALGRGDVGSVAEMLHYPSSYSKEEKATDAAGVKDALEFLLTKLGALQGFERFIGDAVWYEVTLSGGDIGYWESLSPLNTVDLAYRGNFGKFGGGMVSVSFFETSSGMDIRAVIVRVDPSVQGARETVIDMFVELIQRQAKKTGEPVPDNLREIVSASVPDLSAVDQRSQDQPSD